MATRRSAHDVLRANLRRLMAIHQLSETRLARRCSISPKTLNNTMRGVHSPRLETVENIARHFRISTWQLLVVELPDELLQSPELRRLVRDYCRATPNGRAHINRIAMLEAERVDDPFAGKVGRPGVMRVREPQPDPPEDPEPARLRDTV